MPTRDLKKAKEAYKNNDISESKKAHDAKQIFAKEEHQTEGQYIKSVVYGGLDGIITTFAVVAGVAGASLSGGIVLIMGLANLIADGLSMAIGDYLSTKSEIEYQKNERKREAWEVDNYPEGEKKELIEIYVEKGMKKADAIKTVDLIAKNKKTWVDIMMVEELGILQSNESPLKSAIITFFSFGIFGFIPLIAYIVSSSIPFIAQNTFVVASVLTGMTLFGLGAAKVKVTGKNWFISGLEMLIVGGIAASAAFLVGFLLSGLAH